jgi:hypothetical protein
MFESQQLVHLTQPLMAIKILDVNIWKEMFLGNASSKLAVGSFEMYVSGGCFILNSVIMCCPYSTNNGA